MILEVFLEPFFVDTLVNCLGEGAPWVPLGTEKVVGQWVNLDYHLMSPEGPI